MMKQFEATLYLNGTEIDSMKFESKDLTNAGKYAEARFDKAYPQHKNADKIHLEVITL